MVARPRPRAARRVRRALWRRWSTSSQTSPELRARGDSSSTDLLAQPELRDWVARRCGPTLKATPAARRRPTPTRSSARRLAEAIAGAGRRLRDDPVLAATGRAAGRAGARYVAEHFHGEIAALVEHDHRALGRRGDRPPPRAAARPRPAVHPHQRHRGRRPGRPRPPRHRGRPWIARLARLAGRAHAVDPHRRTDRSELVGPDEVDRCVATAARSRATPDREARTPNRGRPGRRDGSTSAGTGVRGATPRTRPSPASRRNGPGACRPGTSCPCRCRSSRCRWRR